MKNENQREYIHPLTGRLVVETINDEPSMTQQQFKDECDANLIINRYAKTGEFLHVTSKQGQYADFSEIQDYQTMLNQVINADNAFSTLPAELRRRFNNNPGDLITFLQNPANYDEGVTLGLLNPKQTKPNNDEQTQTNDDKPKQKKSSPTKPQPPQNELAE